VLDFTLAEGSDDLDNRVNMSKPSRGYFEDCRSFDSVSLPLEVCHLVLVLILDLFLKLYFGINLLFWYLSKAIFIVKAIFSLVKVIAFLLIGFSMQVVEKLGHSFEKTNVDQTGLDASDNNASSTFH